jgi:hypothetical protein
VIQYLFVALSGDQLSVCNTERKARGLALSGVLPSLAGGNLWGHDVYCVGSCEGRAALPALAGAAQLRVYCQQQLLEYKTIVLRHQSIIESCMVLIIPVL